LISVKRVKKGNVFARWERLPAANIVESLTGVLGLGFGFNLGIVVMEELERGKGAGK
jgi:hypothetical protein